METITDFQPFYGKAVACATPTVCPSGEGGTGSHLHPSVPASSGSTWGGSSPKGSQRRCCPVDRGCLHPPQDPGKAGMLQQRDLAGADMVAEVGG